LKVFKLEADTAFTGNLFQLSINQYSFIQRPKWHSRILVHRVLRVCDSMSLFMVQQFSG